MRFLLLWQNLKLQKNTRIFFCHLDTIWKGLSKAKWKKLPEVWQKKSFENDYFLPFEEMAYGDKFFHQHILITPTPLVNATLVSEKKNHVNLCVNEVRSNLISHFHSMGISYYVINEDLEHYENSC